MPFSECTSVMHFNLKENIPGSLAPMFIILRTMFICHFIPISGRRVNCDKHFRLQSEIIQQSQKFKYDALVLFLGTHRREILAHVLQRHVQECSDLHYLFKKEDQERRKICQLFLKSTSKSIVAI